MASVASSQEWTVAWPVQPEPSQLWPSEQRAHCRRVRLCTTVPSWLRTNSDMGVLARFLPTPFWQCRSAAWTVVAAISSAAAIRQQAAHQRAGVRGFVVIGCPPIPVVRSVAPSPGADSNGLHYHRDFRQRKWRLGGGGIAAGEQTGGGARCGRFEVPASSPLNA